MGQDKGFSWNVGRVLWAYIMAEVYGIQSSPWLDPSLQSKFSENLKFWRLSTRVLKTIEKREDERLQARSIGIGVSSSNHGAAEDGSSTRGSGRHAAWSFPCWTSAGILHSPFSNSLFSQESLLPLLFFQNHRWWVCIFFRFQLWVIGFCIFSRFQSWIFSLIVNPLPTHPPLFLSLEILLFRVI